ncbi:MAG: hypothetical protein GY928_22855, partial [Colwellia sp.]|nr:hypothetical protein [Colwellia sp.]
MRRFKIVQGKYGIQMLGIHLLTAPGHRAWGQQFLKLIYQVLFLAVDNYFKQNAEKYRDYIIPTLFTGITKHIPGQPVILPKYKSSLAKQKNCPGWTVNLTRKNNPEENVVIKIKITDLEFDIACLAQSNAVFQISCIPPQRIEGKIPIRWYSERILLAVHEGNINNVQQIKNHLLSY